MQAIPTESASVHIDSEEEAVAMPDKQWSSCTIVW